MPLHCTMVNPGRQIGGCPIRQYKPNRTPRFYGPTKPLFDKTWKLPEVEKLTANKDCFGPRTPTGVVAGATYSIPKSEATLRQNSIY